MDLRGPRLETALRVYLSACRRLRTERDADRLLNLLIGIADPELRLHRFGEHSARSICRGDGVDVRVSARAGYAGDDRAQRVGLGLLDASRLGRVLPPERVRAAVAHPPETRAYERRSFRDESRRPRGRRRRPPAAQGAGRVPHLAGAAGLAGVLERLLSIPIARVVRILLGNPRLTEADVVKLAASRRAAPDALETIAQDDRLDRAVPREGRPGQQPGYADCALS